MKIGCLALSILLLMAIGEVASFYVAHRLLATHATALIGGSSWTDTLLPIIVLQTIAIVCGAALVKTAVAALPQALVGTLLGQGGSAGRLVLRLIAGLLLILPGFFLDLVALILLLPPVQRGLAAAGQRLAMAVVRQQLSKLFPGAGRFPGMQPRAAAPERRSGEGRVIDVQGQRVEGDA
ncbi:MAG: FxsA family protein [Planctomycetes bacterium]|nr:FxsA family protein [Planctomycetota bacterium]